MSALSIRSGLVSQIKWTSLIYVAGIGLAVFVAYFQAATGVVIVTFNGEPFPPIVDASPPAKRLPEQESSPVPSLSPSPLPSLTNGSDAMAKNESHPPVVGPDKIEQGEKNRTVVVGGAPMFPSKNIVENAVNSKDHTTLVAAVKAAGLVDVLEGKGPFTVFAPTNEAFAKLPPGTVNTLVKPENKIALTKILTYHVVPGRLEAADLTDGKKLRTVEGEDLTVKNAAGKVTIIDAKGRSSVVTIANVNQTNGVIHVVDSVLMP